MFYHTAITVRSPKQLRNFRHFSVAFQVPIKCEQYNFEIVAMNMKRDKPVNAEDSCDSLWKGMV